MNVLTLVPLSLLPTLLHLTGLLYFVGALILGVGFAISGIRTASARTNASAKQLLLASIIYLPVLLLLMVIDKV
jgi:protoheme IX farnesyltransferase